MHEHASKMELGDKETVAICIQVSVTCYLHVLHHYTHMVCTIRVYGIQNCTIRVRYIPYAYGVPYAYGTEHFTQKAFVASGVLLGSSSVHRCEIVWLQNKGRYKQWTWGPRTQDQGTQANFLCFNKTRPACTRCLPILYNYPASLYNIS